MDIIRIVRVGYGYYPYPTHILLKKKKKLSLSFTHTHSLSPEPPSSPLLSLFLSRKPPWASALISSLGSPEPSLRWSSPFSNQISQPQNLSLILGSELSLCTKPWSIFTSKNHDLSESERLRVDGAVAVELGGQVVGFGFGSGSRGHTRELRGLRVSLPDFAGELQPREAEPRVSRRRVVGLSVRGEVAGELSRSTRFVAAGEVQELVEEGYLCFDLSLKKKKSIYI